MESTVETLEGNKVKLRVAVPEAEFDRALDDAFRKIAREVRIPGFRPGKTPRRVLEARIGTDAAREEALRDSLPEYYAEALRVHDVDAIAVPDIEITGGQASGPLEFEATVEVRPEVEIEGYFDVRVEVPYKPVDDATIDEQIDHLRERFADLEDSEHPLVDGAYASIDLTGRQGGEPVEGLSVTDFLYEVGSEMVVPELDAQLRGTRPGAIVEFTAELPERFGERAGESVDFTAVVKEAKAKVLPELTDEWVSEASEFDTVDELRTDLRARLEAIGLAQARLLARERVLEAAGALVPIEAPPTLVENETARRVHDLSHRLEHQGATIEQYLAATGRDQESFLSEMRQGAAKAVLADLAVRAVIEQEAVTASDDELTEWIERVSSEANQKPEQVRRELERAGTLEAVRSDLARTKAVDLLVEHATIVDENGTPIDLQLDGDAGDTADVDSDDTQEETTRA
jgi:trigger factor